MAVRRRVLNPDTAMDTQAYGPLPYVSDQAFLEAVLAAAQAQAFYGGVMSVVVDRHPTDMPSEMVTVRAVLEVKDRTDAKPQPEPSVATPVAGSGSSSSDEPPKSEPVAIEEFEPPEVDPDRAAQVALDGLDPATLEEEDLSSIDGAPELVEH